MLDFLLYGDAKQNKTILRIIECVAVLIMAIAVIIWFFRLYNLRMDVPVVYMLDTLSELAGIKKTLTDGGEALGWPYHENSYIYSPVYNALYRIVVHIVGAFSGSAWAIPLNVYICIVPMFIFIVSYIVVRVLGVAPVWSFLGATSFSCYPYIQGRFFWHPPLEAVECVPLVFLMCIWLYEDMDYARPQKRWFGYRKNLLLILFAWLIANNGMIYYPFFSCFIILATGVIISFEKQSVKAIVPALVNIGGIVFWLFVGFIPALMGMIKGVSGDITHGATRSPEMAAFFGLNIRSMLLSPKGWGSRNVQEIIKPLIFVSQENNRAYLGIVMSIGFLALILCLLKRLDKESFYGSRMRLLTKLNIIMLVVAVVDGLGVIVAIFLPYIRCYNRINPFIAFGALLSVLFIIKEKFRKKLVWITVGIVVFIVGLFEMRDAYGTLPDWDYPSCAEDMLHDNEFFSKMEEMAKDSTGDEEPMIFVLPYMKSFENGDEGFLHDYDHLKGYLYTDSLRWSYGAATGSENDIWYKKTAGLPVRDMVEELRSKGFAGIYVNRNGYEDGYQEYNDLVELVGDQGIIGDGQGKCYVPF